MDSVKLEKKIILALQHVLAMFGATVLVPALTGLDPALALLSAGVGTLIFHGVTKGIVPVFLGSSFAFISAIGLILSQYGIGAVKTGIIATGLVYVVMGGIVRVVGIEKVKSFFPPIVVGPMIMVIGLRLSPVAIDMLRVNGDSTMPIDPMSALVATIVVGIVIVVSIFAKGFFKLVPILIAIVTGYIIALAMGMVDVTAVKEAAWIGFSDNAKSHLFVMPELSTQALSAVVAIAPIALVVFIEHIGDITTNGAVVGKNFMDDPGIHRTFLGDGLATIAAGFLGGPPNTTYGENTGVLAVTKVYDPGIIRIAAIIAVALSFCGKFTAIVGTIPGAVMGGISVVLFGMIAAVGLRLVVEEELDFSHSRNLLIAAVIFVLGIGISDVEIASGLTLSGLTIAALFGVILNKLLPQDI